MNDDELVEKLMLHIRCDDESIFDPMLYFYIEQAKAYVKNATGKQSEYLIILVAGIFYEYRISEKEMGEALDALTPFFVQEVYSDAEETN